MREHSAEAPAVVEHDSNGQSSNSSPAAPERAPQFRWTGRDISDAGHIAFVLGSLRQMDHGEAIIESNIELQLRPPRLTDAWRFFHAAALLRDRAQTVLAACAQRHGARIALFITGWTVTDMALAECGATTGLGLYVETSGFPGRPIVTPIVEADGTTALERAGVLP